jgi:hypothetical protein
MFAHIRFGRNSVDGEADKKFVIGVRARVVSERAARLRRLSGAINPSQLGLVSGLDVQHGRWWG